MRIEGSRLLELSAAIGRELGGFRAEMVHSYGVNLVHGDGRMLWLSSSWGAPEGMVTVSGRLDRAETYDGDAACGLERARINASVKRGRRPLPETSRADSCRATRQTSPNTGVEPM